MFANDLSSKASDQRALQPTNTTEEDLLALISNLIDQISELQKRLYELECHNELADKFLELAHREAKAIVLNAEKEAQSRAAALISESQVRARLDAEKIIAEAKQQAQDIAKEQIQSAIYQGTEIIDKAQERYQLIVEDAKSKADEIAKRANQKGKH